MPELSLLQYLPVWGTVNWTGIAWGKFDSVLCDADQCQLADLTK